MQTTVKEFQQQHSQERNLLENILGAVKLANAKSNYICLLPPDIEESIRQVQQADLPPWATEAERTALLHEMQHTKTELEEF